MKNVDLHVHTLHSDGIFSTEEIINQAKQKGLKAISITDHDTAESYKDFDINNQGIDIIPGTELICTAGGCAIEILVYGFTYNKMAEFIKKSCPTREFESITKTEREKALLKSMGVTIDFDTASYDYSVPGAWVIRDFFEQAKQNKSFVKLVKQENPDLMSSDKAFLRKGINNINSKFFVDMSDICVSLKQIRDFCDENHCLMFLAHPFEYGENAEYVLNIAKDYVDGIEIYHPTADEEKRKFLKDFAIKNNLMICGGSDYHGFRGELDSEQVPFDIYEKIANKLMILK